MRRINSTPNVEQAVSTLTARCTTERLPACCSPGSTQLGAFAALQSWQSGEVSEHMLSWPASDLVLLLPEVM